MSWIERKQTKQINIGGVKIGGGAPVIVQSMTNTDTRNIPETLNQIASLYACGCEIVRCAVVDKEAAKALRKIKEKSPIPVIADIHFDYRLAIASMESGVDAIRINPGNIGSVERVKEIVKVAKERGIPIRVGVNSGSVEKDLLNKYGSPTTGAMVESAIRWIKRIEDMGFHKMKISIKSSDPKTTVLCYESISELTDYPLHLGVTEAGSSPEGLIKSTAAMAILLREGIGDTIRISLSEPPEKEIEACYELLNSLHLRKKRSIDFVSCPTCGRIEIDLITLVKELKARLGKIKKPIKVAVMGCVVNAIGESKEADLAIAGGKHFGLIIKKGKLLKKVPESRLVDEFVEVVYEYAEKESE